MIKIENVNVCGWEAAIRGMRNPLNSWNKSDTIYGTYWGEIDGHKCIDSDGLTIGESDFALMTRLVASGSDHRKFMRFIVVTMDVIAPLYWWKEYDTYKVGTVANSCSTMHKIQAKMFELDDFSYEHLFDSVGKHESPLGNLKSTIAQLNYWRERYIETKRKECWWQLIQLLPSSYNQRRTLLLNYEVLSHIYPARKDHKLDEWHFFCDWIETLPYSELITNEKELRDHDE